MENAFRTLLVEDDPSTRLVYETALRRLGHGVSAFGSAEEAWEACRNQSFDLAVLDWVLPGMDGLELCRRIRSRPWGGMVVIVVVTGHDRPEILQEALNAGADDYLTKPISPGLLGLRMTIARTRFQGRTERRQREKELRVLQTAFDASQVGITITDLEGRIRFTNAAEAEMHGFEIEELIGRNVRCLAPAELARPLSRDELQRLGRRRRESTNIRKDGSTFPVHLHSDLVTDPHGEPIAVVTTCEDITERKRLETDLKRSEERYHDLFERVPVGIYQTDREGRIRVANQYLVRLLGFSSFEELAARKVQDGLVDSGERRRFEEESASEGALTRQEAVWLKQDGTPVNVLESAVPVYGKSGNVEYYDGIAEDITEWKRAQVENERAQQLLAAVLGSLSNPLYVIDVDDYQVVLANRATGSLPDSGEVCCYALTHGSPEPCSGPEHPCPLKEVIRTGQTVMVEHVHHVGGVERFVEIHANPLRDAEGRITHMVEFCLDVTDRKKADEKFQESEKKFRELFEEVPCGVFETAVDGQILAANQALVQMLGFSQPAELMKTTHAQELFADPKERSGWIEKLLREERVVNGELILRRKDGREIVVLENTRLHRPDKQRHITFQGTLTDITQLKRAEEALQRAHDELELRVQERTTELSKLKDFSEGILSSMTEGVVLTDSEGLYSFVNPAAATMLGYQSTDQLIGQSWASMVSSDQIPLGEAADERRARGESDTYDMEFLHTDGHRVPCQISGTPRFEQGQFAGTLCVLTNLTERKESEADRVLLSTAIEQANDMIVITDTEGRILYVNPAFEQMTGYTKEQVQGQTPAILKSGRHDSEFYRELWDTVLAGEVWRGHFVNRKADGTHYEEDAAIYPVINEAGKITNFVALKRDVTEEVLLQRRSQHARKMEALGELASGVAHDFNNLLAITQGSIDLLRLAGITDERVSNAVSVIDRATRSAAQLTRGLLGFSRQQVLTLIPVDLNEFVSEGLPLLQRLVPDDIEVGFHTGQDLRGISGDQALLQQVLFNLCSNSAHAMPMGGRITIETANVTIDESYVQAHPWARVGPHVVLSVIDEGGGMDEDTCQRALDPFFTTKEAGKGTGLGLSSALGAVKQHQGWVDIQSELGAGTTVLAFFPVADAPASTVSHGTPAGARPHRGGEVLLVVEDLLDLRMVLVALLESEGYQVQAAADGHEALEILRSETEVAMVITDVNMPRMGGAELYRRSREFLPDLRFVFCSGDLQEWEQLGYSEDTRVSYLAKPFDLEALAQRVREILDRS